MIPQDEKGQGQRVKISFYIEKKKKLRYDEFIVNTKQTERRHLYGT